MHNALVILLTEIQAMIKGNIWLITSHSSHHWIFCLTRNMMTFLVYIEYQNFTRIHIEEIILQVLILFEESNCLLKCLTVWLLSYWEKVYSRSSFNQMWILKYWIFWIIVVIVLFQKFRLSFLHFTDRSPWKCIKTFQNIMKNVIIFKMVRNVTHWQLYINQNIV